MKNLATQNTFDFTVTETGDAYISQRKLEELLGLSNGTISKHISKQHPNYLVSKGLSVEMVEMVSTYYAFDTAKPTHKAKEFVRILTKAGAKAYIYNQAGYTMTAAKPAELPQTRLEWIKLALAQEEALLLEEQKVHNLEIKKSLIEDKLEEVKAKVRNMYRKAVVNNYYSFFGRFKP